MSIDKTTLNRIRIAIQHALCSCPEENDFNYNSMAEACVEFDIIEKAEDFDKETFSHAPILFEKIWEKIGDSHYETPLELFEAWAKDEIGIYRLGEEIIDFQEFDIACNAIKIILSGRKPTGNFIFVGKDFAKLYVDCDPMKFNEMQREAFELMQEYDKQKKDHELAMALGAAKFFGRPVDKEHKTKEGRKFIRMFDPENGDYLGPLIKSDNTKDNVRLVDPETGEVISTVCIPMTHEEAHGKKPEVELKIEIDKEAWDATKRELEDLAKELDAATKNSAEIFCRITTGTYETFHNHARVYATSIPAAALPYIVKSAITTIVRVSDLSEINVNVPVLVYALYNEQYKNSILPSTQVDIVFDIIDSMLELKKEGMIQ